MEVHVGDQLVLLKIAGRRVLIDIADIAERPCRIGGAQRRVDVASEELIKSLRIQVRDSQIRDFAQLSFHTNCALQGARRMQIRINLVFGQ